MRSLHRRRLVKMSLIAAGAALAGCDGFRLTGPPPTLYRLSPKSTFSPDLPTVDWQLLVHEPEAPAALNTVRIALREEPLSFDYFASVAWSSRAPDMVHTLLMESLENTERIVAVGRQAIGLRGDYLLVPELREFQAEFLTEGPPTTHVSISAKLVRLPERQIVAIDSFDVNVDATDERFPSIIVAFDTALGRVLRYLVEWALLEGEADHREQPADSAAVPADRHGSAGRRGNAS